MRLDVPVPRVTLLADAIGVWPQLGLQDAGAAASVAIIGWTSASKAEVDGLEALRGPSDLPVVAVLREMPSVRGARALAAKLDGTVMRDAIDSTLLPTLVAVERGQTVCPATVRALATRPSLSPRERQMLAMLVLGFSNADIAGQLYVTESNVKNHLASAFRKLGVGSRNAAVELILDEESGVGTGILKIGVDEQIV